MRLNVHESVNESEKAEHSRGLERAPLLSPTISSGVHLGAIDVYIAPQFSKYSFDCL